MFKNLASGHRKRVELTVDGHSVEAVEGEMVAGVLARLEPPFSRTNPVNGDRRAPYCMMGVCFECLVTVDGASSVQSCLIPVRDGMKIERQRGAVELRS
tara:strand:- start:3646 stop:3942 length:297 start_codon:yes stop_codon:yes gene_type:complete